MSLVTLPKLAEMKAIGEPIVMVTAYDHPSAQVVEEAGVDIVLVGDTAAMTVLGHDVHDPGLAWTRCSCSPPPCGAGSRRRC